MPLAILILLSLCSTSHAASYWICDGPGQGAADGTSQANCANGDTVSTWQTAHDTVTAGDTIHLEKGVTYSVNPTGSNHLMDITTSGTSASPITMTADFGTGSNPIILGGDRTDSSCSSGDNMFRIAPNVDYWNFSNFDITGWQYAIFTGNSSTSDPDSPSAHSGRSDNFKFENMTIQRVKTGFSIWGETDAVCGGGCTSVPANASTGYEWKNITINNFGQDGFHFENGVQNFTLTDIYMNGGGATYDSCQSGQVGVNAGGSSPASNSTPDRGFVITNIQVQNMNNDNQSGQDVEGDGIKTERYTSGTVTGGFSTNNSESGIDSKGNWTFYDFVSYNNTIGFKSYSATNTLNSPNVTKCVNCLIHDQTDQTGTTGGFKTVPLKAFGVIHLENSTVINHDESSGSFAEFPSGCSSEAEVKLTNTIYGMLSSASGTNSSLVSGGCSGASGRWNDTDNYAYCYDGKSNSICNGGNGTNPQFNDPDTTYDSINVTGTGWDSQAFPESVGWRWSEVGQPPPPPDDGGGGGGGGSGAGGTTPPCPKTPDCPTSGDSVTFRLTGSIILDGVTIEKK